MKINAQLNKSLVSNNWILIWKSPWDVPVMLNLQDLTPPRIPPDLPFEGIQCQEN
jgi:hypothetical protein